MNFFSLFKRKIIYNFKNKILIDHDKVDYKTLDDLFQFYGSDKANIFKKNNSNGHAYSKFYEKKLTMAFEKNYGRFVQASCDA